MRATGASAGRSAHADVRGEPAVSSSNILSFSWPSVAAVESQPVSFPLQQAVPSNPCPAT